MALSFSLDEKFQGIRENFNTYYIHKGDPDEKGSFIPADKVKMNPNGKVASQTVFDNTIVNISKYIVYLTMKLESQKDEYFEEYEGWLVNTLRTLHRLSLSAYEIYKGCDRSLKFQPGFLLKDDVESNTKDRYNTEEIVSNYSRGVEKINEDPDNSIFIGLMQIRILLAPLTYLYLKYPKYREYSKVAIDILKFVVENGCKVYDPYLSRIIYNQTKIVGDDVEVEIGETIEEKKRKILDRDFKMNKLIKTNNSNFCYSAGLRFSYKRLLGRSYGVVGDFISKIVYKIASLYTDWTGFINRSPVYSIAYISHLAPSGYEKFRQSIIDDFNENPGNRKLAFYAALLILEDKKLLRKINRSKLMDYLIGYRGFSPTSERIQQSDIEALIVIEILRMAEDYLPDK